MKNIDTLKVVQNHKLVNIISIETQCCAEVKLPSLSFAIYK